MNGQHYDGRERVFLATCLCVVGLVGCLVDAENKATEPDLQTPKAAIVQYETLTEPLRLRLYWQPASDPSPLQFANTITYAVHRSGANLETYDQFDLAVTTAITSATEYLDIGVEWGNEYVFRVVAHNSAQEISEYAPLAITMPPHPLVKGPAWAKNDFISYGIYIKSADLDGDGLKEVLGFRGANIFRALDGESGETIWSYSLESDFGYLQAAGDLNADGILDVVVGELNEDLSGWAMTALDGRDGGLLWRESEAAGVLPAPVLAEIDDVPGLDVLALKFSEFTALSGVNGAPIWSESNSLSEGQPPLLLEIAERPAVVYLTSDEMFARAVSNGELLWSRIVGQSTRYAAPIAADLNNDGAAEILLPDSDGWESPIQAFNSSNGGDIWSSNIGDFVASQMALADLDGDGIVDIVYAGSGYTLNAISGADGNELWQTDVIDSWLLQSPLLADANGDDVPDVWFTETGTRFVVIYNGVDGRVYERIRMADDTINTPLLDDLDGDGLLELVVGIRGGIQAVHLKLPTSALAWGQFRYNERNTGLFE